MIKNYGLKATICPNCSMNIIGRSNTRALKRHISCQYCRHRFLYNDAQTAIIARGFTFQVVKNG